jgi:hypothetical protein
MKALIEIREDYKGREQGAGSREQGPGNEELSEITNEKSQTRNRARWDLR